MTKINGFTIVELLIVIVVIGILASLSVITYDGIKERADDSVVISKIRAIAELVETYGAVNSGLVPQASWACVGEPEDFPAENGYTAEWCHQPYQAPPIPSGSDHPIDPTVNTKFRTIADRVPSSRIPEVDRGGGYKYRGILYDSSAISNGGKPVLQFYVKGSRPTCPIGVRFWAGSTFTGCEYRFTTVTSETGS